MANLLLTVIGPFMVALLISGFSIPVIITVAGLKQLMDEPDDDRKLHSHKTPTLGGVAIFSGALFAYSAFIDYVGLVPIKFMVPGLLLLFFAGIKDDILLLSAWKKLAVQMVCAGLITFFGGLHLTSLWGMFGIVEIHPMLGALISFFLIVSFINAFNLIDGVNGLAGGLGFVASIFFGTWFAWAEILPLSVLAFSLAGALLGFLFFNFNKAKIFMGDTGSMILGFILSILAIRFVEANRIEGAEIAGYYIKAAPGVALATVIIPLFDMARVFFYRLLKRRSPFSADRNHIHHLLLDLGLSHIQVSGILISLSLFLTGLALLLKGLRGLELTLILTILFGLFTFNLIVLRRKKVAAKNGSAKGLLAKNARNKNSNGKNSRIQSGQTNSKNGKHSAKSTQA